MLFGDSLITILYMIPVLLICVAIHEFAHSYTAYKLGDTSQKLTGRMTLDPFAHFDIMGFLSILLIGFGWGKPVYIDNSRFKNRNLGDMLVALVGPVSNIVLAFLLTILFKILIETGLVTSMLTNQIGTICIQLLRLTIQFNVIFGVFNLLPLPPFDGSKVLRFFLPYKYKDIIYKMEKYTFILILILAVTGVFGYV
ncbi:MAG: site-2 protease family protein, partial [Clostridia bacterium]